MKLLILTSGNGSERNTTETRLKDELIRRGHAVSLIALDELEKQYLAVRGRQLPKQSVVEKLFGNRQRFRAEHCLLPALAAHLRVNQYAAILPTKVEAAEIVSSLLQSETGTTAFTALVSTEYDALPRKADLSCDDYIVMSKRAISTMVDWGINAERIHYVEVSDHTIQELSGLIEALAKQWQEIIQSLPTNQIS